jgi:hypothetical protein
MMPNKEREESIPSAHADARKIGARQWPLTLAAALSEFWGPHHEAAM